MLVIKKNNQKVLSKSSLWYVFVLAISQGNYLGNYVPNPSEDGATLMYKLNQNLGTQFIRKFLLWQSRIYFVFLLICMMCKCNIWYT